MEILTIPVRQKTMENTEALLKHLYTLTCMQALTLGSNRGAATQEASETDRERLSFVASGIELERQLSFSLCRILFLCSQQADRSHLSCVELSLT